jgi:hypothetical protein
MKFIRMILELPDGNHKVSHLMQFLLECFHVPSQKSDGIPPHIDLVRIFSGLHDQNQMVSLPHVNHCH